MSPSGRSHRPRLTSSPPDRRPGPPNGSVPAKCWTGRRPWFETERGGCRHSSNRPAEPAGGRKLTAHKPMVPEGAPPHLGHPSRSPLGPGVGPAAASPAAGRSGMTLLRDPVRRRSGAPGGDGGTLRRRDGRGHPGGREPGVRGYSRPPACKPPDRCRGGIGRPRAQLRCTPRPGGDPRTWDRHPQYGVTGSGRSATGVVIPCLRTGAS